MTPSPVLNLTRLDLDRAPGISGSFAVTPRPGVNLIVGPNEAGKSSLVRAIFQLLWPDGKVIAPFSVHGTFTDAAGPLRARRDDNAPVAWTRAGESTSAPDLPGGHLARCYRLGLLDLNRRRAGELDRDLAREVKRQMAGGFDLAQVRERFPDHGSTLNRRRNRWREAHQIAQQRANEQRRWAVEERRLEDQRRELERSQQSARRADQLEAVREHQDLAARATELVAQLAELPADMGRVRAGDDNTLAQLQRRIGAKNRQGQELKAAIARRAERIALLTVSGDLSELERVVQQVEQWSVRAAETERQLAGATGACAVARGDLAPELLTQEIPADTAAALSRLVQSHRELTARQVQVEHLERLLAGAELQDDAAAATPPPSSAARTRLAQSHLAPPAKAPLGMGLVGLGTAAVLYLIPHFVPVQPDATPLLSGLALLLGGMSGTWLGQAWRARLLHRRSRRALEEQCRADGQPLPAGWTTTEAFAVFMDASQAAGATAATRRTQAAIRAALQDRLDAARAALAMAETARRKLLRELGRDEHRADPGLLHELDQLARWRAATAQEAAARGAHDQVRNALTSALADGQARLAAMGLVTASTLIALQAGRDKLVRRRAEAANLAELQVRDEELLHEIQGEADAAQREHRELITRLALPPLAARSGGDEPETTEHDQVSARVAALPNFERWTEELRNVRRALERARQRITSRDGPAPAAELLALSSDELDDRLARERRLAAGAAAQRDEIIRIEEHIAAARRGNTWEQARAAEAERAADLSDLLDEQRRGVLGRLLLDTIERRHEHDTQPPLLSEMNRFLGLFTGGRYRLLVTSNAAGGERLLALDNADRRLELTELSDGTRAQLLLAARLAFLIGNEKNLQAPLFLDEALTASDPARFDAIAGALGTLATATGRQVFYLTSSPADQQAWQRALRKRDLEPAHVIDLGMVRGLAAAATTAELELPAGAAVPSPEGMTAAAYGVLLQVPPLRPWDHPNTVHVFHLWRDDLLLVRDLVLSGLPTLGQWRRQGQDLVGAGVLDAATANRIDARGRIYDAFVAAWRVGRGRPVTREDLAASAILSPAMLPLAQRLLAEVKGDGAAFMAGIQAGKVKRLQEKKKEALQDFLERRGHLDQRPSGDPDQLVAHVLGAVAEHLHAEILDPAEVRQLVLDLAQATDSGPSPRSVESGPTG